MHPNLVTKTCQNCKLAFTIAPEDFEFYNKVHVPPPTWCPSCRMQRRMAWRNERGLHMRTCDLCAKSVVSLHPADARFPVYCQTCWWTDKWDPMSYGRDYDFSKSFFEQFKELQSVVPRQHTNNYAESTMVNSQYSNCSGECKNCYMIIATAYSEDLLYTHYLTTCKSCVDCLYLDKSEWCYDCFDLEHCYQLAYSQSCVGCRDSLFLFDCRNCSDCIGCIGLRNQQYHILNEKYSKEEYEQKKKELKLDTREGLEEFRKKYFSKDFFYKFPRKCVHGQMNKDSTGDYISNSENSNECFYTKDSRGCNYCFWFIEGRDCYDCFAWGGEELCYETVTGGDQSNGLKFCNMVWGNVRDMEYCDHCFSGDSDCFGCVGLRGKKFCILNKQYSEEEYYALTKKIREDMTARGEYGEFFPFSVSPFPYWDTVAQEHFPLTKEQVLAKGYNWREPTERKYSVTKNYSDLPNTITEVTDEILKETISCEHNSECAEQCTKAFKIIPAELKFYREMNIPLPTLCYQCRHASRVKTRNPLKLWDRTCAKCSAPIKTSYSPERPEIVYCESCYNAEVA